MITLYSNLRLSKLVDSDKSLFFVNFNIAIILKERKDRIMGFNSIHETVIEDILNTVKDGVKYVDGKLKALKLELQVH